MTSITRTESEEFQVNNLQNPHIIALFITPYIPPRLFIAVSPTRTHIHTHTHTNTHIRTHTYTYTPTLTYTQTHTYSHTHTHLHTQTYTHLHTPLSIECLPLSRPSVYSFTMINTSITTLINVGLLEHTLFRRVSIYSYLSIEFI